jgi:L-2-hydroxyglutarate oxidase
MSERRCDVAVVGGGIVGLATARALAIHHQLKVIVLEAESHLAAHQSGHNSGVIHSGLYYKPGSMKATTCSAGREAMIDFCEKHEIDYDRCGKVVVATSEAERPWLDELESRGQANGLTGTRRIDVAELKDLEPHVFGVAGLHVPETGIVDYKQVCSAIAEEVCEHDGEILTEARLLAVHRDGAEYRLETAAGEVRAKRLVNCAGLQSDRVATLCGVTPKLRIIPFRGEYYKLVPEKHHLVNNLIYPVPNPSFPFLGVHFTRMIHGGIEAGPNAVLAFKREGYEKMSFSFGDLGETLAWPGFWKMASKHWQTGFGEMWRSWSKAAFVGALQKLMPELQESDVIPHGAGVRAQAVAQDGSLLDDFAIERAERQLHVLNAPSPAATASLAIGESIASMLEE